MISNLLEVLKQAVKSRIFPMVCVFVILFGTITCRMFYLQIIKGEEYEDKSTIANEKVQEVKSARGKIFDCNGKLLASNEQNYAITLEDTGEITDNNEKNEMIIKCIRILEEKGNQLDVEFPIYQDKKGKFCFSVDDATVIRFKKDIFYKKTSENLSEKQNKMKAKDVYEYLRSEESQTRFEIDESYSTEDALKIMAVRYNLMMNRYKKYMPITLCANVDEKTVAAIKENSAELPGVEVSEELKRVYYDSEYFAHIIGYTGLISADTLAQMKEEDENTTYTATDQIGKTGIEKTYESTLKGKKGSETLVIDDSYRVVETKDRVEPVAGNDIYLTIDADLQKAYYKILEKKLAGILISKLNNSMNAGTKGKSASDIRVPIYDVYDAIIQNNVVDISKFNEDGASSLAKSIYQKYVTAKKSTNHQLKSELRTNNERTIKQLSDSMQDYMDYIYGVLVDKDMLMTDVIDKTDKIYNSFLKKNISLSKFLQYAISQNWINLELLDIGNKYYSTEEIYAKLVDYIFETLDYDVDYDKEIYHNLIYNYKISGREICLLLFDQNVIKKNKTDLEGLRAGTVSPYEFLKKKIRSLEITPGQLGLEPCSGSVVVTDVNTGKVLAMVSYPSYDNNRFANSVDSEYFATINSNKASPLLNRATQQKTAPGSTYKPLVAAASLQEGIIDPYSTVTDRHTFTYINPSPKCWSTSSHGTINVSQALRDSCNYFFFEMGYRLGDGHGDTVNNEKGLKKIAKYAKLFGLSDKSGVEVAESEPTVSDEDTVRSAIGQGTNSYTPVQLSRYVTTIANEGTCYDLTIVDKIVNVTDNKTKKNKAKKKEQLSFSNSTWDAISYGMRLVVKDGGIRKLFDGLSVHVAGKTGTAQESVYKPNHALFVSYAPYENPEISVTAVIANGYTSSNAAELASDVYKYYFQKDARKKLLNQKVTSPKLESRAFAD